MKAHRVHRAVGIVAKIVFLMGMAAGLPAEAGEEGCPLPGVDVDTDGICDDVDNCPDLANADQLDADEDGVGDACDGCPEDAEKTEEGICGCGVSDADSDEDALADCVDNCPADVNVDQADGDDDGVGDVCDLCPESIAGGTVVIDKCETLVENGVTASGCTFMEEIEQCAADANNHGKFVRCVAHASKRWTREDELGRRERSRIVVCAALSSIPGREELRGGSK